MMGGRGMKLLQGFESCRLTAYLDAEDGWTIGWGHLGAHEGQTITQEEADALLAADLRAAEAAVTQHVRVALSHSMRDALISWTYNLGTNALQGSTMLKQLNSRDYLGAATELIRWHFDDGERSLGLLRRRFKEASLFLEDPIPK